MSAKQRCLVSAMHACFELAVRGRERNQGRKRQGALKVLSATMYCTKKGLVASAHNLQRQPAPLWVLDRGGWSKGVLLPRLMVLRLVFPAHGFVPER